MPSYRIEIPRFYICFEEQKVDPGLLGLFLLQWYQWLEKTDKIDVHILHEHSAKFGGDQQEQQQCASHPYRQSGES